MHTMTDHDRSRLQQLLMKAELDLEGLNFNDPIAVDQFMTTSREIRAQLAALKRYESYRTIDTGNKALLCILERISMFHDWNNRGTQLLSVWQKQILSVRSSEVR